MKAIVSRYAAFVRQPHVARLLAVAIVTRMPIGMVGFSMLMFLREALGDFALAGAAVGTQLVSLAAAAPVLGRLIDRLGPRSVLYVTAVVQPLALLSLLWAATSGAPFAVVAFCAGAAGVFASPITTLTRTMWRHRFQDEEDRRTAFALDAVTIEVNFTVGPAIVALVIATAGATMGFALAIGVVVVATAVYVASGVLRLFKPVEVAERHLFGPLTEPRLWVVFIATFGLTLCFGQLEVGYPAFATSLGMPAFAGALLAFNSLGSAVGGAIFGGLTFKAGVERQFAATMALMAIPLALHAAFLQPAAFFVVSFFAGALIAPSITAQSVLVSRLAPSKYATEAFTWSSTFIVSGIGAGMAVGGLIVERVGLSAAFATGAVLILAMALLALVGLKPRG